MKVSKLIGYLEHHPIITIIFVVISWRLILTFGWFLGRILIPGFFPSFPYSEDILQKPYPLFLWPWANFDGVHYLKIAQQGYLDKYSQVFFPFYPLLVRWLGNLIHHYLLSGLIISHLSLIGALILLIKLFRKLQPKLNSFLIIITLLLFPTSYYFGGVYTESLFLFLSVAGFYFAYQKKWWLSGILGGLASLTRLSGIFLFPSLLIIWYQHQHSQPRVWSSFKLATLFWILLVPLGLFIYMYYLHQQLNDPLYFVHAQPYFSVHRQVDNFTFWPQVVWRYIKMILTVPWISPTFFTTIMEFVIGISFALLSILTWKKLGVALGLYTLANYLLPTFTGSFSSVPRYVLILFPAFVVLAQYINQYRWLKITYFTISPILLISCVIYFTRGWWIA